MVAVDVLTEASGSGDLASVKTTVEAIPTDAMRGTDNAALASLWTSARADVLTDWADGNRLDALLDAIKAKTDQLIFTIAGLLDGNMKAISDDTVAADNLEALMDSVLVITVDDASATVTDFATDGFTETVDDIFNGRLMTFLDGASQFEQTDVTDYDAAGGAQGAQQFTVTALVTAPANNVNAIVH